MEEKLKSSIQEKDVLLKEVHHRVKNNLQITSSLLSLQKQTVRDNHLITALTDSQARIQSMSYIHELLYESENIEQVNLADLLKKILTYLTATYQPEKQNINVNLSAEDIFIKMELAIPCGLIMNELISNVFKHAFSVPAAGQATGQGPSAEPESEVKIQTESEFGSPYVENRLTVSLYKSGPEIIFETHDNGKGLPKNLDMEKPGTLGMELVFILAEQIGGSLTVIPELAGTHFSFNFSDQET
jgi:two-component sensor histidine kinase